MTRPALLLSLCVAVAPVGAQGPGQATGPLPVAAGSMLPRLEGDFLSGRKAILPDDLNGKVAVLLISFSTASRQAVEDWAERLLAEYADAPGVAFFQVPVLGQAARLGRWFIDSEMRKATPKEFHENVITVYASAEQWKTVIGFSRLEPDTVHLLVLDATGRVRGLQRGPFSPDAFAALRAAIAEAQRMSPVGPSH
jgi:hypothetical protein